MLLCVVTRRRLLGQSLDALLLELGVFRRLNEFVPTVLDLGAARASYDRDSGGLAASKLTAWPTNGKQLNVGNACAWAVGACAWSVRRRLRGTVSGAPLSVPLPPFSLRRYF